MHGDRSHVFALGDYDVTTQGKGSVQSRFIHLRTVHDGKSASPRQATDKHVAHQALNA